MAAKKPTPDAAQHEAYFPSEFSLKQYVPPKTDYDGPAPGSAADAPVGLRKILVVMTDERYLPVEGGKLFSTGNHPVETLLPLMHLQGAGYEVEVATLSGNLAKFEEWAMPPKDKAVQAAAEAFRPLMAHPKRLADVVENELGDDSPYAAVFVPGGHGAVINLSTSTAVRDTLAWALRAQRPIITLCHGPAALLAATGPTGANLFAGYEVCVFPDALDRGPNVAIGYLPGQMVWVVGERLQAAGVRIVNDGMTGAVHRDRLLLTGDSPLAANALGRLAVQTLTGA